MSLCLQEGHSNHITFYAKDMSHCITTLIKVALIGLVNSVHVIVKYLASYALKLHLHYTKFCPMPEQNNKSTRSLRTTSEEIWAKRNVFYLNRPTFTDKVKDLNVTSNERFCTA